MGLVGGRTKGKTNREGSGRAFSFGKRAKKGEVSCM